MRSVFADTFFWVALLNPRDSGHAEVELWLLKNQNRKIITTDEIVIELLNAFSKLGPYLRKRAGEYAFFLFAGQIATVYEQSRHSLTEGLNLYLSRLDKEYSLTDCISMSVMKSEGITDVLTQDIHFSQEGYVALFR